MGLSVKGLSPGILCAMPTKTRNKLSSRTNGFSARQAQHVLLSKELQYTQKIKPTTDIKI